MTTTYKILGQQSPAATTNVDLYTVPAITSTVASTLIICNRASNSGTFRVAARQSGAAIANQHYLNYDTNIPANDTIALTIGMTLAATDVITVYSSSGSVSFSLFGSELT